MSQTYDSAPDTRKHIALVRELCLLLAAELEVRGFDHDSSKLEDPEKAIFDAFTPKLKDSSYMSAEYKGFLQQMQGALQHHYQKNRHHPEHSDRGIRGMNLLDLLEMVADWVAASQRHADGDPIKSVQVNQTRFGYGDELCEILLNTVRFLQERRGKLGT